MKKTPVFPQKLHRLRTDPKEAAPNAKSEKRDNVFSKSRDMCEDRSARQMKTKQSSQTLFHICALL
jgi:hypothetical protein